jgi:hypothetical protein
MTPAITSAPNVMSVRDRKIAIQSSDLRQRMTPAVAKNADTLVSSRIE